MTGADEPIHTAEIGDPTGRSPGDEDATARLVESAGASDDEIAALTTDPERQDAAPKHWPAAATAAGSGESGPTSQPRDGGDDSSQQPDGDSTGLSAGGLLAAVNTQRSP